MPGIEVERYGEGEDKLKDLHLNYYSVCLLL
jgi:hypothetical protein